MTFRSLRGRAGRSRFDSLLRLVGARVVARLAFTTNHLGLPATEPPRSSAPASPSCPVQAVDSLTSSAFPSRTLVVCPVAFASMHRQWRPVPWRVAVAFGDPRTCSRTAPDPPAAAGAQSPALAGIFTSLPIGRWSTSGAPRASAFLSWDSKSLPLRRLSWCGPLPARRQSPVSELSAEPCQWLYTFRPRRFSRPRRLSPAPGSQACCIPLPTLGSARFPVTSSRDLPHTACQLPLSRLTALCRSPLPFQQAWCFVSRLSPSPRTPSPFEAFPVHAVACSVTCDALTRMK